MNAQTTGEIVAENLSLKTYKKLEKYLTQCGEQNPSIQRINAILQNHFDCVLSQHIDSNFDKGETDYEEMKKRVTPFLSKSMTDEQKESFFDDLSCLYIDGFFSGFISGARHIETMLNDLDERTET